MLDWQIKKELSELRGQLSRISDALGSDNIQRAVEVLRNLYAEDKQQNADLQTVKADLIAMEQQITNLQQGGTGLGQQLQAQQAEIAALQAAVQALQPPASP